MPLNKCYVLFTAPIKGEQTKLLAFFSALGQVVPKSAVIMLLSRVQAFALQRGTVYDLLVGRHLLPDIQLGVRKNAVFGGNVLDAVVHLLEIAAAGQIARGGEVAALIDPHIPPIGFKIEVGQHIVRHIQ